MDSGRREGRPDLPPEGLKMPDPDDIEAYLASLRAYNQSRSEVNQKRVDAHFFVLSGPDQARAIHIAKGEGLLTPDKD